MVDIQEKRVSLTPPMRLVDAEGRATTEFQKFLRASIRLIEAINIVDGEITTEMLADLAVKASKLDDGAVVIGKLAAGSIYVDTLFANSVVVTRAVANNAITGATVAVSNDDIAAPGIIQTLYAEPEGDRLLVRGAAAMYSDSGLGFPEYGTLYLAKDGVEVASYYFFVEDVPSGYFGVEYIEDNPTEAEWTLGIRSTSGPINAYGRVLNVTNLKR